MPKSFVHEDEAGSLGTTPVLPDLFQVLAMKREEIAEELDVAGCERWSSRSRDLAVRTARLPYTTLRVWDGYRPLTVCSAAKAQGRE
jgi:hypothetical protein